MNPFMTLLKREWLEARLPFLWLPLGTLAFLVVASLLALLVYGFGEVHILITSEGDASTFFFIDRWSEGELNDRMTAFRSLVLAPFYLVYIVAALFVLLGALYDDRKDRSILFWKSMPVSDYETVASKLILTVAIAPMVMLACALVAQIYLLTIGSLFIWSEDFGDASRLWWHSGIVTGFLKMVLGFLIQALWSLPVAGYLLLISASVPKLTLLWAIVVPIGPALLERILFNTQFIATGFAKHMEPAAIPNFTGDDDRIMPVVTTVGDQLSLFLTADMWIGVLFGVAFLYAAVRMRGLNNEL